MSKDKARNWERLADAPHREQKPSNVTHRTKNKMNTYSVKFTEGRTEEIKAETIDLAYLEVVKGIPAKFLEEGLGFTVEGPDGKMECGE